MLLILCAFAALRYNTGWDYAGYYREISEFGRGSVPDDLRYSFIWKILFSVAGKFHCPHLGIIIPNILTYLCIYKGLKLMHLPKFQIGFALLVYACWYAFYINSFSIIRQALAEGVVFMMFPLIQERRFKYSILLYITAIVLHSSALMAGWIYVFYFFRNRINFINISIIIILIVVAIKGVEVIIRSMAGIGFDHFAYYLKLDDDFGGKMVYINLLIGLFFIITLLFQRTNSIQKQIYALTIVGFIGGCCVYFVGALSVIARMFDYLTIFLIIGLYPALKFFKPQKQIRLLAVMLFGCFFLVYLLWTIPGAQLATSSYVPYKFIFMR